MVPAFEPLFPQGLIVARMLECLGVARLLYHPTHHFSVALTLSVQSPFVEIKDDGDPQLDRIVAALLTKAQGRLQVQSAYFMLWQDGRKSLRLRRDQSPQLLDHASFYLNVTIRSVFTSQLV